MTWNSEREGSRRGAGAAVGLAPRRFASRRVAPAGRQQQSPPPPPPPPPRLPKAPKHWLMMAADGWETLAGGPARAAGCSSPAPGSLSLSLSRGRLCTYLQLYSEYRNEQAPQAAWPCATFFGPDINRARHGGYQAESLSLGPCKSPGFD